MNLEDAIRHAEEVAEEKENEAQELEYSKLDWKHEANLCKECAEEHRKLAEWLRDYKRLKEQEPCEDEYIKVPKKALKYRTAGMVAYNAEWLKNHFDIERAVICGAQQPILDKIRAEIDKARFIDKNTRICKNALASGLEVAMQIIDKYKAESEDE